ncbi:SH3 domain-binding protein 2-like isoform X2 [Ptychodera flava]
MASTLPTIQRGGYKGPVEPMSTIGAQDLLKDDENVAHVGWVYKREREKMNDSLNLKIRVVASKIPMLRNRWKNSYMIIHKGCLYIYNSDSSKKPRNCFSLLGYSRVMRAMDIAAPDAKSFVFKLIHIKPDERAWYFATGSDREMQLWMAVIKSEMEKFSHGEVSGQTHKLVLGLKRPSFTHDSISLADDDAIYNALEMGVKYDESSDWESHNYSDLGDSAGSRKERLSIGNGHNSDEEDHSSDEYEEPWEEEAGVRTSVIDRPLPQPPGVTDIDSRPPAPLPSSAKPQSLSSRPQMPIPGQSPTPAPKPKKPQGVLTPGGVKPAALRPWEKDRPPATAPRPHLTSSAQNDSGPTSVGVKMPEFRNVQLRKVQNSPGRQEPEGQSVKESVNETSKPDLPSPPIHQTSNAPVPNKRYPQRPLIPTGGKPLLPAGRTKPPAPAKREQPLLPASAMIDSSDKALTEQYLNAHSQDGMYLVRNSREPGAKVIVVFDGPKRSCLQYKVFSNKEENTMYLQQEHPSFDSMESLLKFYKENSLPTTVQKLTKPYPGPK